ncbi:MAG: FAD-dependent oxidoreductase [Sphingomonadales bacterium]
MTSRNAPSRRQIIKGAGIAAAATVAAGVAAPPARAAARKWDHEADIVVVGSGAAALTAAVIAVAEGGKVIVVEKNPLIGGTTAKSGSVFWICNHYALKARGIDDKKEDALKYLCKFSYPEDYTPDSPTLGLEELAYRRLEAFYDNGSVMTDRIRELGAMGVTEFKMRHVDDWALDYQSMMPENKTPAGRALCPANADGTAGDGMTQIDSYEKWLTAKGVPILTDHKVTDLVMEDGAAVGVEADFEGRKVLMRGRQAVIFGTGGFAHNVELIRRFQMPFAYGACAQPGATGDFVAIAERAGARLGNMAAGWRTTVVFEEAVRNRAVGTGTFVQPGDSSFVVNKYGKRIVNEKRNYNDRTRIHAVYDPNTGEYPNLLTFYIFDQRVAEAYAGRYPIPETMAGGRDVISGQTLDELSANIAARLKKYEEHSGGLKLAADFPQQLKATFDRYNGFAKAGKDLDFGRGDYDYDRQWHPFFAPMRTDTKWKPNDMPNVTMHPLQPQGPYYAIILAPGFLDTNGGPEVNEKAQILDASGAPIPGLYGAGNCVASPARSAYYAGGGTIGIAMTYGYIAALNARKEPVRTA